MYNFIIIIIIIIECNNWYFGYLA